MRLTKYDQETIINFNQGEEIAYIYTCSKVWMAHFEKTLGLKPTKIRSYAREYECPKAWIGKPRRPRQLSEKRKHELRQRFTQRAIQSEEMPCAVGESGGKNVR